MANVVEIEITGKDATQAAFGSAARNMKTVDTQAKTLKTSFDQLGRVASAVGGSQMGAFVNAIENIVVANRKMEGGLKASRIAIMGIGAAVGIAVEQAFAFAVRYYEKLEAEAEKRIKNSDALIKAVQEREDLLDPAGASKRAVVRNAASQAQQVRASGQMDPEALKQIELTKQLRLRKMEEEEFNKLKEDQNQRANVMMDEIMAKQTVSDETRKKQNEQRMSDVWTLVEEEEKAAIERQEIANQRWEDALDMADAEKELIKTQTALRKQQNAQIVDSTSQMFGNLANTAKAFGKKGFVAYKAFATAQAIIDTYKAANAAYSAMAGIPVVGPALGIAAAAAAIAAGLANVAAIQTQKPSGQAHAGMDYVPREGSYNLQRGEIVLDPGTSEKVRSGLGMGPIVANLVVDGQVFFRWLLQASRDGRLEISSKAIA